MKARVKEFVIINKEPASVGSIVEVDANTFANLVRKGRLEAYDEAESAEPKFENREDDLKISKRNRTR